MADKRELPLLYVVLAGSSDEFPRFTILDAQDRPWNGQEFGPTGVLYASHNDAATDAQNILRSHFDGEPQRYVVPLYVEVYSQAEPVPLADVAKYLSEASRLYLDTTEHGNGPDDALALPWIDWSRIKQIKEFPND
jgi:hypothetical protein